jgi:transcription elongation factor/antiterminator RfaH
VPDDGGSVSAQGRSRWYAVNTRPNAEKIAVANLERQGFRSFLPSCIKTVRHARKFRTTLAPLFPGYLFVSLDITRDRWRSVNGTHGVVALVMTGGEPRAIPTGIVETLQDMAGEGSVIRFGQELKPGQRVKLLAGPFAEQIGVLERLDGQGRVRVLLEMMGSTVPVASTADQLLRA